MHKHQHQHTQSTIAEVHTPRVVFIDAPGTAWLRAELKKAEEVLERDPTNVSASRTNGVNLNVPDKFDLVWMEEKGVSGRRVVVKGLPYGLPEGAVRGLVGECGLIEGEGSVVQLPP